MKHLVKLICVAALTVFGAAAATANDGKMLSIVTAENAEAQAMAFVLANQVQARGTTVHVLLCGPAGDVALAKAPESATQVITPKGMTIRKLMGGLLKKGGAIDVCAIYLPNRKLQADALMEGVGVAKPQDIAAMMADPTVKIAGN